MQGLNSRLLTVVRLLAICFAAAVLADAAESEVAPVLKPGIWGLDFSPDGKWLAAGTDRRGHGGPIVVWRTSDWTPHIVRFEEIGGLHVAFSPDSRFLAYSTRGTKVYVIDVESREVVREIDAHNAGVMCIVFTPDGKSLLTSSEDHTVKLWDIATGTLQRTFEGHTDFVLGVAVSPDGTLLLTGGFERTAWLWDLETGEVKQEFGPRLSIVRRLRFSDDGQFFLVSSWDGHSRLHETSTGRVLLLTDGGSDCADLTADNRFLATAGWEGTAHAFRVTLRGPSEEESRRIQEIIGHFADDDYSVREAASAEIVQLGLIAEPVLRKAMDSDDAEVRLRCRKLREQVRSPKPTAELTGHAGDVEVVCFSPDGRFLATGCRGGDIKVWSVPEFKNTLTLHAPPAPTP